MKSEEQPEDWDANPVKVRPTIIILFTFIVILFTIISILFTIIIIFVIIGKHDNLRTRTQSRKLLHHQQHLHHHHDHR